jgi:hypothetical protein
MVIEVKTLILRNKQLWMTYVAQKMNSSVLGTVPRFFTFN